jgi:hypothetical protein
MKGRKRNQLKVGGQVSLVVISRLEKLTGGGYVEEWAAITSVLLIHISID